MAVPEGVRWERGARRHMLKARRGSRSLLTQEFPLSLLGPFWQHILHWTYKRREILRERALIVVCRWAVVVVEVNAFSRLTSTTVSLSKFGGVPVKNQSHASYQT